jgi:hypothetical protein
MYVVYLPLGNYPNEDKLHNLKQGFSNFLFSVEEPPKQWFISRNTPAYENEKPNCKKTAVSSRRLFQYFQLPENNFSRYS